MKMNEELLIKCMKYACSDMIMLFPETNNDDYFKGYIKEIRNNKNESSKWVLKVIEYTIKQAKEEVYDKIQTSLENFCDDVEVLNIFLEDIDWYKMKKEDLEG